MADVATTFEDLSSEMYFCIFDHLDTYHLYKAFSKLNSRFNDILNDKHLLLTLDTRHNPIEFQMPEYAIPRVRSITSTTNNLLLPHYFHDRIEQITFTGKTMTLSSFENIFKKLNTLPKLSTIILTVTKNELYNQICNKILFENYLPQLKRFMCNTMEYIVENKSLTTNQLLSLTVSCTITDLYRIFQYSPQLTHIDVSILNSSPPNSQFDVEALKLERAKLSITWHTEYNDLEQILSRMPNLKYLGLVGTMSTFVINNGRSFRQLFSVKLDKVKLNLQIINFPYGANWIGTSIFDVDSYWHNVKWTKNETNFFFQSMQLTALGYKNKE